MDARRSHDRGNGRARLPKLLSHHTCGFLSPKARTVSGFLLVMGGVMGGLLSLSGLVAHLLLLQGLGSGVPVTRWGHDPVWVAEAQLLPKAGRACVSGFSATTSQIRVGFAVSRERLAGGVAETIPPRLVGVSPRWLGQGGGGALLGAR